MVRTSRGVAGEKAVVLLAQREQAQKYEKDAQRTNPSLATPSSSKHQISTLKADDNTQLKTQGRPLLLDLLAKESRGRKGLAMSLEMDKKLDMGMIQKGSFVFMTMSGSRAADSIVPEPCLSKPKRALPRTSLVSFTSSTVTR
ncbi:hypothetical protein AAE478_007491 [Parahypoxylon ruwenzoriense]